MIHFRSHNGFTLLEIMLSLVIVGIVLGPIFLLHGAIMQRMNTVSHQFYGILVGKQLFYQARQKQDPQAFEFTMNNQGEHETFTCTYNLYSSVADQSSLYSITDLRKEIVTITWQEHGKKRAESIVSFIYKEAEQKKS
jgi:prepilin-type N-terminal cleavage/methylation domain-containing protein